ncbi:glycosyltransferase family 87 protein [Streptomyces polyrhachis]|uniref:Glycosyltransferase family 87 protein n=1 Tax=Streptomyces polyrhachis TaxID=1282885 RepID=A0ABW2GBS4_9ACTN
MSSLRDDPARPGPRSAGAGSEPSGGYPVPVPPTVYDALAARASALIGGPAGRRTAAGVSWWTPVRVVALIALGMFALGMVQKLPCYDGAWFTGGDAQYTHLCYSDIPHLYQGRGFAQDLVPYFDPLPADLSGGMGYLEYPVLTGLFMEIASWLTPQPGDLVHSEQVYWLVNSGMLLVCTAFLVVCVVRTHGRRPWDGLLLALAPAFALTATINWDLLAVALTAASMLMWSRSRPLAAGILLGLATAAKLYPVLLLGALFILCLRAGRWREYGTTLAGALGAWLAVNLPVMYFAWDGWVRFYAFSRERGVDYGSFWLIISQNRAGGLDTTVVNTLSALLAVLLGLGVLLLALWAPRRPRYAQLAFLLVAVFILTNKVYSPQYVLWLIPLAALARPRWRDFLLWQACEVVYFAGIWLYLARTTGGGDAPGLSEEQYHWVIAVHLLGTLYLCAVVVRDMLLPERDPVRAAGDDDPAGGPLDWASDTVVLGHPRQGRHALPADAFDGLGAPPAGQPVRWGTERWGTER